MNYTVSLAGSDDVLKVAAASFQDAAAAYGTQIKLPERGWLVAMSDDGNIKQFEVRNSVIYDDKTALTIPAKEISILPSPSAATAKKLELHEYIFSGLPLALVFLGGAIGGALGGAAFAVNISIFMKNITTGKNMLTSL